MERRRHLSQEDMIRALEMLETNSRQHAMAVALGTTQCISRLWISYALLSASAEDSRGRSRMTTCRQDRYIQITTRRKPTTTAMMLLMRVLCSLGMLKSDQTNHYKSLTFQSPISKAATCITYCAPQSKGSFGSTMGLWTQKEKEWRFVCFFWRISLRCKYIRRTRYWRNPRHQEPLKSCPEVLPYSAGWTYTVPENLFHLAVMWLVIPQRDLNELILRMPIRCDCIILINGGNTVC